MFDIIAQAMSKSTENKDYKQLYESAVDKIDQLQHELN